MSVSDYRFPADRSARRPDRLGPVGLAEALEIAAESRRRAWESFRVARDSLAAAYAVVGTVHDAYRKTIGRSPER